MQIIQIPPLELLEYSDNPRIISENAINAVADSIRRFGFRQPIVVDKDRVIIIGHVRQRAALTLGLETVPVVVADTLTPDQIDALRLVDNRTGELSDWDDELLEDALTRMGETLGNLSNIFTLPERRLFRPISPKLQFGTLHAPWGEREERWIEQMESKYGTGKELTEELTRRLLE